MGLDWSANDLRPEDRIGLWCEFLGREAHRFTPVDVPDPDRFGAGARGTAGGGLALLEINADLRHIRRTATDIAQDRARDRADAFFVRRYRTRVRWRHGAREAEELQIEVGDFCIVAGESEFEAEAEEPVGCLLLVIPHTVLAPLIAGGRVTRPFRVDGASSLGALLASALEAAAAQAPLLPAPLGVAVLRNLAGLVALVCDASQGGRDLGAASAQSARLEAIKRHVEANLADTSLSAASTASAVGISVRQLHLLFEPTGTTFGQYVLRQRLLRCRDAIAGATGTSRKVTDIAFGWGFGSMATFYRAFAAEFGAAPLATRGTH